MSGGGRDGGRPMLDHERAEHLEQNRHGHDWRCLVRAPWTENGLPIICTRVKGHDQEHQAASCEARIVREWPGEQDALPIPSAPSGADDTDQEHTP